ncbi:MAG: cytochrome c biogenesis protein CcmG/thiol:disulfide interchange protein DsbE [Gammaproteobacteria bacterium]|jgi:cytochrome c biogenesis protein CcmG/thiol:disulfide interchange protein DsbE
MRYAIPIAVFVLLVAVLAIGLTLDPRHVPSPLIGKPLPTFALPDLHHDDVVLTADDLTKRPRLLNVWASWCVACRVEHPLLLDFAKSGKFDIVGLNYKDERKDALAWLTRHGNPYKQIVYDRVGRLGLDLGVYGVPETFVIDRDGIIRHKQVGPVTGTALREVIIPLLEQLASKP